MNSKEAIQCYLFAERAKTNMITISQMLSVCGELKGAEKSGAKLMIKLSLSAVIQDLSIASRTSGSIEFKTAVDILNTIDAELDNDEFEKAVAIIGTAMTQATTPAQMSWQVLAENELI